MAKRRKKSQKEKDIDRMQHELDQAWAYLREKVNEDCNARCLVRYIKGEDVQALVTHGELCRQLVNTALMQVAMANARASLLNDPE